MSKKETVLVGMDCGSGNIATVMATNNSMEVRLTPSYVRSLPGVLKETDARNNWITVGEDGAETTYAVQSKAVNVVDTRTKDYQLSAACRVLVANALSCLGLGGKKVIIADTLPADQFYDDNYSHNSLHIEQKRKSLQTAVRNANKGVEAAQIVEVRIMPEAVTSFNAALYDEKGEQDPRLDGVRDVVVVDLGRYTKNIAHIDCETHGLFARSTDDQGVHAFLTLMKQVMIEASEASALNIPAETLRSMTLDDIDTIARAGYYGSPVMALKDKRVPTDEYLIAAAKAYASEIRYKLGVAAPQLANADALIMVGGGMYYIGGLMRSLPNLVKDWHGNVVIPHQPETANARGAFFALQAEFEETQGD